MSHTELPVFHRGVVVAHTLIDLVDLDVLGPAKLYLSGPYVARAGVGVIHRELAGATRGDGKVVHHRNGNRLDNRRANLEVFDSVEEHAQLRHPWRDGYLDSDPTDVCRCLPRLHA